MNPTEMRLWLAANLFRDKMRERPARGEGLQLSGEELAEQSCREAEMFMTVTQRMLKAPPP